MHHRVTRSKRKTRENVQFSTLLRCVMRHRGWNMKQLANYLEQPYPTTVRWVKGAVAPYERTRNNIEKRLGLEGFSGELHTVAEIQEAIHPCSTTTAVQRREQLCDRLGILLYRQLVAVGAPVEIRMQQSTRKVELHIAIPMGDGVPASLVLHVYPSLRYTAGDDAAEIRTTILLQNGGAEPIRLVDNVAFEGEAERFLDSYKDHVERARISKKYRDDAPLHRGSVKANKQLSGDL